MDAGDVDIDEFSADEDEVRHEERRGLAGLVREATGQILAEKDVQLSSNNNSVTPNMLMETLSTFQESMMTKLSQLIREHLSPRGSEEPAASSIVSLAPGRLQRASYDWGDGMEHTLPPLYTLRGHDLDIPSDRVLLSKARFVMESIFAYGENVKEYVATKLQSLDAAARNVFLQNALYTAFGPHYKATNAYITAYDTLKLRFKEASGGGGGGDGGGGGGGAAPSPLASDRKRKEIQSTVAHDQALYAIFKDERYEWSKLSDEELSNLLNQRSCCCGCTVPELKPLDATDVNNYLGYAFCTSTKLRLRADRCKYRYGFDDFDDTKPHPCNACGAARLTLLTQPRSQNENNTFNQILCANLNSELKKKKNAPL